MRKLAQVSEDDVQFEFAFICDDVRAEVTGKLIFVGVYPNSIGVGDFPTKVRIQLVLAFHTVRSENLTVKAVAALDGETITETEGVVSVKGAGRAVFGIPMLLQLARPGNLSFDVTIGDRKFGEVLEIEATSLDAL